MCAPVNKLESLFYLLQEFMSTYCNEKVQKQKRTLNILLNSITLKKDQRNCMKIPSRKFPFSQSIPLLLNH